MQLCDGGVHFLSLLLMVSDVVSALTSNLGNSSDNRNLQVWRVCLERRLVHPRRCEGGRRCAGDWHIRLSWVVVRFALMRELKWRDLLCMRWEVWAMLFWSILVNIPARRFLCYAPFLTPLYASRMAYMGQCRSKFMHSLSRAMRSRRPDGYQAIQSTCRHSQKTSISAISGIGVVSWLVGFVHQQACVAIASCEQS